MELKCIAQRQGRLSSFLKRELQMSTGLMNRLKWGDSIRVNGNSQHTDYPVQPGDVITVTLDEETPEYPAQPGELNRIYEDEWLLAVDKPARMLIHPSQKQNQGTLANFVTYYYQQTGQKCAFHPLTRLDRDTFGIVLLAKNAHIHALLQSAHPRKTYQALCFGVPPLPQGEITAPIARCELPSLLRRVDPNGKPCHTIYRVLESDGRISRLELHPVTGRTHQLRVHCAWMGCPILGDPQYGSVESQDLSRTLGLEHQMLCARQIDFRHPITGEEISLHSRMYPALSGGEIPLYSQENASTPGEERENSPR